MIKELIYMFVEYIRTNTGKTIGAVLGFIIAIMMLIIGFFKTIFIVLCVIIGYLIGDRIDKGKGFRDLLDKILIYKK